MQERPFACSNPPQVSLDPTARTIWGSTFKRSLTTRAQSQNRGRGQRRGQATTTCWPSIWCCGRNRVRRQMPHSGEPMTGSSPILEASTSLICCWMVPKALLVHWTPELSPGRQALRQHPNRPHRLRRAHRHRLILRAIHDVDAENRAQGTSMTLASTCPRASGARFWHGSGAPASPSSSSGPHPKRAYKQTF